MPDNLVFIIAIACVAVLMIIVGFIGNKIVDKTTDRFRNDAVRRKNQQTPPQAENLRDRFETGRKL